MAEGISISLNDGHSWRTDKSFGVLMEMMIAITREGWRAVQEGVSKRLRLDAASRAQDGNPWDTGPKTKDDKYRERAKDIGNLRRGNKGLDMELLISSVLSYLDSPKEVRCNCHVYKGMPNKAAGGDEPDIVFRPAKSADFQIVCEVSANKGMTNSQYGDQLESALCHAEAEHEKAGVSVTYVLLVNLREAGSDKGIRKVYREFVKKSRKKSRKKNAKEGAKEDIGPLRPFGPLRFVLMEAAELSTLMKELDYHDILDFESHLLAEALDNIHEALLKKKTPTGGDWMADRMISLIYQEATTPVDSLYKAGPQAVE